MEKTLQDWSSFRKSKFSFQVQNIAGFCGQVIFEVAIFQTVLHFPTTWGKSAHEDMQLLMYFYELIVQF